MAKGKKTKQNKTRAQRWQLSVVVWNKDHSVHLTLKSQKYREGLKAMKTWSFIMSSSRSEDGVAGVPRTGKSLCALACQEDHIWRFLRQWSMLASWILSCDHMKTTPFRKCHLPTWEASCGLQFPKEYKHAWSVRIDWLGGTPCEWSAGVLQS